MPVESISIISEIRKDILQSGNFNVIAFHLVLGFILSIVIKLSYFKKLFLITLIPAFGFLLLTIAILVMGDSGKESAEGFGYGLIVTAIDTCSVFVGVIAGLILLRLREPNKSLKNDARERAS